MLAITAEELARSVAVVEKIPLVTDTVAKIRQLPPKSPVVAAAQTMAAYRAYVRAELARTMPAERTAREVRALVRLGLLKGPIDAVKTLSDVWEASASSYFDTHEKKIFVVSVADDLSNVEAQLAHEVTHALVSQRVDLGAYEDDPDHLRTRDAQAARQMIVEGDATLTSLAYLVKGFHGLNFFDRRLRKQAQSTIGKMGGYIQGSVGTSAPTVDALPPVFRDEVVVGPAKGMVAVSAVRDAGGWAAVNKLYENPPESTEQVLHPAQKLVGRRDHPVVLALRAESGILAGLTPVHTDVVGELAMGSYFRTWGDVSAEADAVGWGGDRYAVYAIGGRDVAVWFTTWDTARDAVRFASAYESSMSVRFAGETVGKRVGVPAGAFVSHPDGTVTVLARTGKDVLIVDGAPASNAAELLAWLASSTRTQAR